MATYYASTLFRQTLVQLIHEVVGYALERIGIACEEFLQPFNLLHKTAIWSVGA